MKNGKAPTRKQKILIRAHGLRPDQWLIVKNLPDVLVMVSRRSLGQPGKSPKYRTLNK